MADMDTTLIILKPDAVQRGLCGRILSRFEEKGLKIVGMKMMKIGPDLAARHYQTHQGKSFYDKLLKFMTSSPVLVVALQGINAIEICRKMMGATFGSKAEPGTIRGDYAHQPLERGSDRFLCNLVHASANAEDAEREVPLWFGPDEVLDYAMIDDMYTGL